MLDPTKANSNEMLKFNSFYCERKPPLGGGGGGQGVGLRRPPGYHKMLNKATVLRKKIITPKFDNKIALKCKHERTWF